MSTVDPTALIAPPNPALLALVKLANEILIVAWLYDCMTPPSPREEHPAKEELAMVSREPCTCTNAPRSSSEGLKTSN
jgi:hypothetical protein